MKTKITSFLVVVTVSFISFSANAQIFKAGLNAANISITNDGDVDENNVLGSFQLGVTGNIKILPMLYFQPGIIFTGKGSKTQSGNTTDPTYYRASSNPRYIEVPVNFVLKTPTGPVKLFAGAGPYIAVGVSGKNKVEGKFLGAAFSSEKDIRWSDDDPSTLGYEEGAGYGIMKRFDYGLNALAGIELTRLVLAVGYGHGLAKLQSGSGSGSDDQNKHRVFSVTVGLRL
ncbi:MAG: PorT family protein [Chitinophagaceae bacterium]|nr:PorT family protein [Chitinophagaceae bacterium]